MLTQGPPRWMFDVGSGPAAPGVAPLACVAGALIVDSGEEDPTFVFRCQDRYPIYTALAGLRSLLFVLGDAHVDLYAERLADLRRRLDLVREHTDVLAGSAVAEPLFVGYDPMTGRVEAVRSTTDALASPAVRASVEAGLHCNQLSPTYAALLASVAQVCREGGVAPGWDTAALAAQADRCARAYDKAHYVDLLRTAADPLVAPHVATGVHDPDTVLACRDWEGLCALLPEGTPAPRRLHVKSTMDSGGNVAVGLGPHDLSEGLAALAREWRGGTAVDAEARARLVQATRAKVAGNWVLGHLDLPPDLVEVVVEARLARRAAHDVRLLVQPRVEPPPGHPVSSVGCSFRIDDHGAVTPLAVSQQVFADAGRKKHLGACLSRAAEDAFTAAGGAEGYEALCALYAAQGYRGPISFDAVADEGGRYVGVYDCNPRLTAVFPALAVQRALRADGLACDTIVNLDYRGIHTWPDAATRLDDLDGADMLYTRERGRGVLPLPNMARPDSFDLHLVNLSTDEVDGLLGTDLLGPAEDADKGRIAAVYT